MPVSAGQLRHKVTLQKEQETTGPYGQVATEWVDADHAWAEVAPLSGREYIAAQAINATVDTRITIRHRRDITPKWRISYRNMTYDIHAMLPDNGSGLAHLTLMCEGRYDDV